MTLAELRQHTVTDEHGTVRFAAPYTQMALSLVEAEFLYALVRLVRPSLVMELGTGYGISTRFIAEALRDNEHGRMVSVDPWTPSERGEDGLLIHSPVDLLAGFPVLLVSELGPDVSEGFPDYRGVPDLVFIDSGVQRRAQDIANVLGAPPGPLVLVHDANRDYPGLRNRGTRLPGTDGFWIGRADGQSGSQFPRPKMAEIGRAG